MHQSELFGTFERNGWKYLANGCYSSVFAHDEQPEWIIKRGNNDGTRTFLEWCLLKTSKGERMEGMPHVEWIVPVSEHQYMVAMKRYSAIPYDNPAKNERPEHHKVLKQAFEADNPHVSCNDMHSGNRMIDPDTDEVILTDPSADSYHPVGFEMEFELS